jgi:cysteine-rich repeat protein
MPRRFLLPLGGAIALGIALAGWEGDAAATLAGFPDPVRGWETIPGAIRADGVDRFRVEVDTNGPVAGVTLVDPPPCLVPDGGSTVLHDDGLGGDRIAGDGIFTSDAFRWVCAPPAFFRSDPTSPAGVDVAEVGTVEIVELDGTTGGFIAQPSVAVVDPGLPAVRSVVLSDDVAVTRHVVNVRSDSHQTQRFLRYAGDELAALTHVAYGRLPDAYDFLLFFSTDKVERQPARFNRNFVAGSHRSVLVDFVGTGEGALDNRALYGSAAKLLGVNALDAYGRGLVANVVTHEIQHQWAAYLSPTLGLSDGVHYLPTTSVGSLLGGFRWLPDGAGGFVLDCTEGRGGAFHAAALDQYMMGLVGGSAVPPLMVAANATLRCGEEIGPIARTVTIADIQALHGVRTPGPAGAQRDFHLGFVAESRGRLLGPTEMAFYETLAAWYTRPLAPSEPDGYHGSGQWVPIGRFFGPGTTWRGDIVACGDGVIEGDEECDDGNADTGDGCDATCHLEAVDDPLGMTLAPLVSFNPRSNAILTLTVLSTTALDARALDVATLRFGPHGVEAAPLGATLRDANRDARPDLTVRFRVRDAAVACGTTAALLTGRTFAGQPAVGGVALTLVGCSR